MEYFMEFASPIDFEPIPASLLKNYPNLAFKRSASRKSAKSLNFKTLKQNIDIILNQYFIYIERAKKRRLISFPCQKLILEGIYSIAS
jgi:hypothetical protein